MIEDQPTERRIKDESYLCRICKQQDQYLIIRPCSCQGSQQYIHKHCLQQKIQNSYSQSPRNIIKIQSKTYYECQDCEDLIQVLVKETKLYYYKYPCKKQKVLTFVFYVLFYLVWIMVPIFLLFFTQKFYLKEANDNIFKWVVLVWLILTSFLPLFCIVKALKEWRVKKYQKIITLKGWK